MSETQKIKKELEEMGPTPEPPHHIGMRILAPEETNIFKGTFSLLHCTVVGEGTYRAVFAISAFPVQHREKYISLRYFDESEQNREIGIIKDLRKFSPKTQELIRESLSRYYFDHTIERIYNIEMNFNLLFLDVETTRGPVQFVMKWQQDSAHEFGEKGKVLLDVFENRYLIRNVSALRDDDKRKFLKYIYW